MSINIKPFKGRNSYTVYVPILNFGANQINAFTDTASRNLLSPANQSGRVIIRAVESFYNSYLAYDNQQRPIVTAADAANLAVTFRVGQDTPIYQLPYLDFSTQLNFGMVKEIEATELNLSKSEVVCLGALADNTKSVAFVFWYDVLSPNEYEAFRKSQRQRLMQQL